MKLVVGLGNPGRRYYETRHNVGFMVAEALLPMIGVQNSKDRSVKDRFDGEFVEGQIDGHRVGILCPKTFMNSSGTSVRKAVDFYKLPPSEVLVICDCMSLSLGQLRIRSQGSSGGQKGLGDILRHLGTESVPRLRIGIDPAPPGWAVPDYVLSKFRASEMPKVRHAVEMAADAVCCWVLDGIDVCMNRFNVKT